MKLRKELMNCAADRHLQKLMRRYAKSGQPERVSFRQMASWLGGGERATHFIHPYPAKLLAHIPNFFLAGEMLAPRSGAILDPFCGSGTVLLEATLSGRRAIGVDTNPLARLIAEVKTTYLDEGKIRRSMSRLLSRIPRMTAPAPNVVNLEYWFYPQTIAQLAKLAAAVKMIRDGALRKFFLVCLSNCVRRVSLIDPRLSVPVRLRADQYEKKHPLRRATELRLNALESIDVVADFSTVVEQAIRRMNSYGQALKAHSFGEPSVRVLNADARSLRWSDTCMDRQREQPVGLVDLVLTSPPYVGAQKYIRASSLSIGWLELSEGSSLRDLEKINIGREHYSKSELSRSYETGIPDADREIERIMRINPLRAHIAAEYLREMVEAISGIVSCLRTGGFFVLVAGNNQICGREFNTQTYLRLMCERFGLSVKLHLFDEIRSRGLMTRRNTTAGIIKDEAVYVMQKVN
jgi:16S rRNA G966 N2-methylase RsmD